jgi:two-component system response regulator HupR/HoxA
VQIDVVHAKLRRKNPPDGSKLHQGIIAQRYQWIGFAKVALPDRIRLIMNTDANAQQAPTPKRGAVLLVDDEKPLLDLYAEALGPFFDIAVATSTKEAGFLLHKRTFKVVVSDHLMPGGNGLSFLVDAREEHPEMQRVLVTGYMKPEMLLRSVNEAALFRYLLKPVSLPELIKTVQEAAKLYDQAAVSRG